MNGIDNPKKTTLLERQNSLVAEFASLASWEDRYKRIIAIGKALPDLPESLRTEAAKVKGCQSQVWLHAKLDANGNMDLQGDSDALLVKGIVGLLLRIYSGVNPEEVLVTPPDFIKAIGFEGNLSPSRSNGLFSMIKQIQLFAQAFVMIKKSKR